MTGIVAWGTYLPHRRLDRATIAAVAGQGGGKGHRTVASYDQDTTSLAVEAARLVMRGRDAPQTLWFSTAHPAYADKTNATAIHAALCLPATCGSYDANGSVRSTMGALRATTDGLVVAADTVTGLPGSPDEAAGGDAAAAFLLGEERPAAVVERWACVTEEFLDRWRAPGDLRSRQWEERFGETRYTPIGRAALDALDLKPDEVDLLVVAGQHDRACAAVAKASGVEADRHVDRLAATVGNPGAAQPLLLLAHALDQARPGQTIVLVTLADGADALVVRTTADLERGRPTSTTAQQAAAGAPVAYGQYLAWRGLLPVEPPRRPEPARPSASAAGRNTDWKFGLTTPDGDDVADKRGTVTTFTIDRLAYSPSPPVVFAVVDFDGGGRLPVELTDVDAADVAIGMRVEMTFRRLFTADGIHNYFWKARPTHG